MITANDPQRLTLVYALPFVAIISILFISLLIWERRNLAEEQMVELTNTATALVQQIILTRSWNAGHNGVYAEITDRTQPNPYLDDPQRDITSLAGRRYTKINPAYMTRQIAELARERHQYRQHLTSLNPLNPENTPDPWEEKALLRFEHGAAQQMTVVQEKGGRFFRLMVPLVVEKSCLTCHAKQHYRIGDVRGGLSVTIPMSDADRIHAARERTYVLTGLGLWLCIIVFIVLVSYNLSRKVARETVLHIELSRLTSIIELAGAAAHELRQPLTVLVTLFSTLKKRFAADDEMLKDLDIMTAQCERMDKTIEKMRDITKYKAKTYVGNTKIIDLDNSSGKSDK
jgi:hypothetical protein